MTSYPSEGATGHRSRALLLGWTGLIAAGLLAGACGTPAGAEHPATSGGPTPTPAPRPVTQRGDAAAGAAAGAASHAYRDDMRAASAAFVADVGRLSAAVSAGDVAGARTDELAAQGDYDHFRPLTSSTTAVASALDEEPSYVVPGASLAGLHAIERDLWSSGNASADLPGLVAQAPVAARLVSKVSLSPEEIGTAGVDALGWVDDVALPGREEQFSHLDVVDVAATVSAAREAFAAIEPLCHIVDPALTVSVAQGLASIGAGVAELGPPTQVTEPEVPLAARLSLSRQVDAAAALLARLAAELAPFGTSGSSSALS